MLELNKVYNMDCIEGMKLIPDNSIDSIVTDPPYEIGFMGKGWDSTGVANNIDMRKECLRVLKPGGHLLSFAATRTYHRMACAIEDAGFEVRNQIYRVYGSGFPKSLNIGKQKGCEGWEGRGTGLKPAVEPICMARKPLAEKTVAENVLKYGTGGINIDESRVGTDEEIGRDNRNIKNSPLAPKDGWNENSMKGLDTRGQFTGRFPANLILSDCEEVRECFPETKQPSFRNGDRVSNNNGIVPWNKGRESGREVKGAGFTDTGNASRFFKSIIYQAKASKSERNAGCEKLEETETVVFTNRKAGRCPIHDKTNPSGLNTYSCGCPIQYTEQKKEVKKNTNNHPTVKPTALMEYLIKMVTKEGGTVLDPFTGSGTTLVAAKRKLYNYIGFELSKEYCDIIEARLRSVQVGLF